VPAPSETVSSAICGNVPAMSQDQRCVEVAPPASVVVEACRRPSAPYRNLVVRPLTVAEETLLSRL
jgi:hypothetical protein